MTPNYIEFEQLWETLLEQGALDEFPHEELDEIKDVMEATYELGFESGRRKQLAEMN